MAGVSGDVWQVGAIDEPNGGMFAMHKTVKNLCKFNMIYLVGKSIANVGRIC